MQGLLVVCEGLDGAGKTTQIKALHQKLSEQIADVVLTREPGGTAIGEGIRNILLDTRFQEMTPQTEALLYAAARAQFVQEIVKPVLRRGGVVLSDRFSDSFLAYQGYGRRLDLQALRQANDLATEGLQPNLVIILDLPPEEVQGRLGLAKPDRLEQAGLEFYQRVRQGFLALAAEEPERYLVLDGNAPVEYLASRIYRRVEALLGFV